MSRLYSTIRPEADYIQSLELLARVKEIAPNIIVKSGFMLGLGETEDEIHQLIKDLHKMSVDILTTGQYLPPSDQHAPLVEYVHPDVFKALGDYAKDIGIANVASAPLVRSSYHAHEVYAEL